MTAVVGAPLGSGYEPAKPKGVMKKVLKYFQDQAVESTNSGCILTPKGLEPHQRDAQDSSTWHLHPDGEFRRKFSEATTVAEFRYQDQRGNEVPSGTFTTELQGARKSQYAQDNILQNHHVFIPNRNLEDIKGHQYWIVYIHGGYFRDPKVDATSFRSALELLTEQNFSVGGKQSLATVPESTSSSSSTETLADEHDIVRKNVAGYASINYRLAPHPAYPQDENTEGYVKRNAQFPDQLNDVHTAIRHLQHRHGFDSNYILCGHSVGATLAFLAALKSKEGRITPPACVAGVNGIYDFPNLHKVNPAYESLTKNAISPDLYKRASPALYALSEHIDIQIGAPLKILLTHSKDDGLVGWDQLERMHKALKRDEGIDLDLVRIVETKGQHDAIWKEGKELARSIVEAVKMVIES